MTYQPLPLGTSDFKALIEEKLYYVDKTNLIHDIINGARITLLPRPRRFGKTLNMSMLQYFFNNNADYRHLFNGFAIEQNADAMKHCGQYPVIFLSFKDVKVPSFERCLNKVQQLIQKLYGPYAALLNFDLLLENERTQFQALLNGEASQDLMEQSIQLLSNLLHRHYQKNVVILIDEYDMPINHAYSCGYYDEMIGFMRNLLSGAFKDNPCLFKGVMTGILRVARESIFSGLNNIDVCTLTDSDFCAYFGFTVAETEQLLDDYSLTHTLPDVRTWYNGYNFGETTIYNPWSILHFVKKQGALKPYWLNTSDNLLVRDLIGKAPPTLKQELETLLIHKNATLRKPLNENVVFRDIHQDENAAWNFLLFCGYLRYENRQMDPISHEISIELSIPNAEVRYFYTSAIMGWFQPDSVSLALQFPAILDLLLKCDFDGFSKAFRRFCADTFSYFDVQGKQPERFYHAFVLGMLVQLQATHSIKSNRESGYGRYDVCLIPHDKSQVGFVFEFKSVDEYDNLTLEQACEVALKQIADKQYVAELQALGIETVYPVAMAFEGKRVLVRFGEA